MSMCTIIRPPTSVLGLGSFWLDNLQYFCQRWRASDTFTRSSRAQTSSSLRFDGFCAAFFNCHPRFSRTDSLTTLRLTLVQVCLGITVVQVHHSRNIRLRSGLVLLRVQDYQFQAVPVLFHHSMEPSPRSLQTIPKSFSHIPVDPTWASWSRAACLMESS